MERRTSARRRILVDIEIAQPGGNPCRGYAENVSREGVAVVLWEGELPPTQRSVILNFKIWTGTETLCRKLHARILRIEAQRVALAFAEHDMVAGAIVQDLIYYKSKERRQEARRSIRHTPQSPASALTRL